MIAPLILHLALYAQPCAARGDVCYPQRASRGEIWITVADSQESLVEMLLLTEAQDHEGLRQLEREHRISNLDFGTGIRILEVGDTWIKGVVIEGWMRGGRVWIPRERIGARK